MTASASPPPLPAPLTVSSGRQDPVAVERILRALPDWFGIEEAILEYTRDAARMPTYLARWDSHVVGIALVRRHFPESAEIHLIAVDPVWHRRGVGRAMLAAAEQDLAADGVVLLQTKTVGPSYLDEAYALTREFYRAVGYLPLEELPQGTDDPCPFLIQVKTLR